MKTPDFEQMAADWVLAEGEFNVKWLDRLARHAYEQGLRRAVAHCEKWGEDVALMQQDELFYLSKADLAGQKWAAKAIAFNLAKELPV